MTELPADPIDRVGFGRDEPAALVEGRLFGLEEIQRCEDQRQMPAGPLLAEMLGEACHGLAARRDGLSDATGEGEDDGGHAASLALDTGAEVAPSFMASMMIDIAHTDGSASPMSAGRSARPAGVLIKSAIGS